MRANLGLVTLPPELLVDIAKYEPRQDLGSLVRTAKSLNEIFTPLLYADIDIGYSNAQKCIRTLASDPASLAFGRDLAALVRSFTLRRHWYGLPSAQKAKFARRLERAVGRMTGIQHFALDATYIGTPMVVAALMRAGAGTLRSLELKLADDSDAHTLDGLRPALAQLTSFSLTLWEELPWLDLIEHVLTSRADHLRSLTLSMLSPTFATLVRNTHTWLELEELDLFIEGVPNFASLPATPRVRSLSLRGGIESKKAVQVTVPPDAFPKLESLRCPYQLLPAFLPPNAEKPRPIRIVRLDDARYDEDGGDGDFSRNNIPDWEDVREALACLPCSAGPVTDLSFYIDWFDAEEFGGELAEYVGTLERLLVVLYQDPGNEDYIKTFGEALFAHAPRLHTFLLSDAPAKANDSEIAFGFAHEREKQRRWLQEWDRHTNALKKVAFTTEFMWVKTNGGWRAPSRVTGDDTSSDEDGEDDERADEDSSDESEGSVVFVPKAK